MDRLLSVVVSVYNEEKALEDFYREATGVLKGIAWEYELISSYRTPFHYAPTASRMVFAI